MFETSVPHVMRINWSLVGRTRHGSCGSPRIGRLCQWWWRVL